MKKTALTIAMMAICLTVTAGFVADSLANDLDEFSTRELQDAFRKTEKELKTMKNLEKKLESAGRQSSNTARKSTIEKIQDHMATCILRREDNLGQEHTIKMHGGHVKSGTTSAAEVGSPVGTSRAKTSLAYVEGIKGYLLRQLSLMQSLFIAAQTNRQPAIERQGDSLERYASHTRRFREELERNVIILEAELGNRAQKLEADKDY